MTVITEARIAGGKRDVPLSMIERMTLILDAFDGRTARLTLNDIARRSRLPRSTTHRILDSMVKLDWVEHTPFGYGLGKRALGIGGDRHTEVRATAAPALSALHLQTGMVVHLSALNFGEVVYLDKIGGSSAPSIPSRVGGRAPAYSTAGGKAMLAWLDPEQVEALFSGPRPLDRCADRTITDMGTLYLELNRIRQRKGLSFEREESARGVACVGVAIRGHEGPVAAVSLCGDVHTAQLERFAPLVVDAAREISRGLFPELGSSSRVSMPVVRAEETWSAEVRRQLETGRRTGWI